MPGIAPLAARQLAAWEEIADGWDVSLDASVWRCVACMKGIALHLDREGNRYRYSEAEWRAQVVIHLRNHHPDLDPDKPL